MVMGHCKHGEFNLAEGCPECIAESRSAIDKAMEESGLIAFELKPESELVIVKVRYISESTGEESAREYSYFSIDPLNVGDKVTVPVRDRVQKAVVTAIDVPESEIEAFRDQVKTIPSGKRVADAAFRRSLLEGANEEARKEMGHEPKQTILDMDQVEKQWASGSAEMERQAAAVQEEPPKDPPGMNLVPFMTDDELAVRNLFQEGVKLLNFAQARIISTNEDLKPATDDLAIIKKTSTALEEYMKKYVGPIQDHLKEVRTAFGELLAPFKEADQLNRDKVKGFRNEQARKAAEAQRIEDEKLKLAQDEMRLKGEHTQELGTAEGPPPVPDHTRTEMGTQGFQKVYKWEIIDFAQVPDQYKMPDAGKITGVVKGSKGTIEIPGIRIWTDEVVRINPK